MRESFTVEIEDAAIPLIRDNYLMRGEFLILEVVDFEIPELENHLPDFDGKSAEQVNARGAEHSHRIRWFNTSASKRTKTAFSTFWKPLFEEDYLIERDELKKIGQFEDNLPNYEYLTQVKNEKKKGRWFIFTGPISGHYLNHLYTPKDTLALTYATGEDLATQIAQKNIHHHYAKSENGKLYPLGKASTHSEIHIQMAPKMRWGEMKFHQVDIIPPSILDHRCYMDLHTFKSIHESLNFTTDFENVFDESDSDSIIKGHLLSYGNARYPIEDFSNIVLAIGDEEFSFRSLIEENKAFVEKIGKNYHFTIVDLSQITEMEENEEKTMALKLQEIEETTHEGLKLTKMQGEQYYHCPELVINFVAHNDIPFAVDSVGRDIWGHRINWNNVKRGESKTYQQNFSVDVSSIIIDRYN